MALLPNVVKSRKLAAAAKVAAEVTPQAKLMQTLASARQRFGGMNFNSTGEFLASRDLAESAFQRIVDAADAAGGAVATPKHATARSIAANLEPGWYDDLTRVDRLHTALRFVAENHANKLVPNQDFEAIARNYLQTKAALLVGAEGYGLPDSWTTPGGKYASVILPALPMWE